jgi:hypothetical protein
MDNNSLVDEAVSQVLFPSSRTRSNRHGLGRDQGKHSTARTESSGGGFSDAEDDGGGFIPEDSGGGFIPGDTGGGFMIEDTGGGFIPEDTAGGFIVEDTHSGSFYKGRADDSGETNHLDDLIPLSRVPSILRHLNLRVNKEVMEIFESVASLPPHLKKKPKPQAKGKSKIQDDESMESSEDEEKELRTVTREELKKVCEILLENKGVKDEDEDEVIDKMEDSDLSDVGDSDNSDVYKPPKSPNSSDVDAASHVEVNDTSIARRLRRRRGKKSAMDEDIVMDENQEKFVELGDEEESESEKKKTKRSSKRGEKAKKNRMFRSDQEVARDSRKIFSMFFPPGSPPDQLEKHGIGSQEIINISKVVGEELSNDEVRYKFS